MNEPVTPTPVMSLKSQGYIHGKLSTVLDAQLLQSAEWKQFADSWNNLSQDGYMADGGTYRERRYSEFSYDTADDSMALLAHVPYSQTMEVNYLNGGIERHFDPFEAHVADSPVLRSVFQWCAGSLSQTVGEATWKIQTFQNRILARSDEDGQPTPEGMHRDGVDFVLTLLIDRNSINGGASAVYDAKTQECLEEVVLSEPGEFLFADDERLLHSVTPLSPSVAGGRGHRDVLIAMFTRIQN
ncbi:2OG-Fe dioxygenase family protein [Streptomyces sp. NPDC048434]|uniref:2OG-Fe dioxygenase family protein n=1 Tax=Streptomyces sp. NPDC048434 TaxID=3365549 RepID=UPI00371FE04D